jgi:hypothetical protein
MKIHELIAILENHPNQDADVDFVFNNVDLDDNEHDIECENSLVLRQDDFYWDFVEILVSPLEIK